MAQSEKFLFETIFDADGRILQEASQAGIKKSYTPDEVDELKKAAYADGLTGVEAQVAQQNAQLLGQISESMVQVITNLDEDVRAIRADATQLALTVADRICQTLIAKEPQAEIIALIDRCLESLPTEPHIVVRVSEDVSSDIRSAISEIAAEKGFGGKILVMAEPELAATNCRVEWADGGVERDVEVLGQKIEAIVNQHLAADVKVQGDLFDETPDWMSPSEDMSQPA